VVFLVSLADFDADHFKRKIKGLKGELRVAAPPYISRRQQRAGLDRSVRRHRPAASRDAATRRAVLEQPVQTGDRLAVR